MHLSAPIYRLKRKAKLLARQETIPLHAALDRVAAAEGKRSWSHLAASSAHVAPVSKILSSLDPGDIVLLGARPGQGKTMLGLELAVRSAEQGGQAFFFTLDYSRQDVAGRLSELGFDSAVKAGSIEVDTSDDISADYIIGRLEQNSSAAIAVVDYLQLLDQKRSNPGLWEQIKSLKAYARSNGVICVLISQIDRTFDAAGRPMPGLADVRLPNPLDLSLFDKACFVHNGDVHLETDP